MVRCARIAIVCSREVTKIYDVDGEPRADVELSVTNAEGERKIEGDATVVA